MNQIAVDATPIDPPDPTGKGEVEYNLNTTIEELRYGSISAEDAAAEFTARAESILS